MYLCTYPNVSLGSLFLAIDTVDQAHLIVFNPPRPCYLFNNEAHLHSSSIRKEQLNSIVDSLKKGVVKRAAVEVRVAQSSLMTSRCLFATRHKFRKKAVSSSYRIKDKTQLWSLISIWGFNNVKSSDDIGFASNLIKCRTLTIRFVVAIFRGLFWVKVRKHS